MNWEIFSLFIKNELEKLLIEILNLQNVSINKRLAKQFWISQTFVTVDGDIFFQKPADKSVLSNFLKGLLEND